MRSGVLLLTLALIGCAEDAVETGAGGGAGGPSCPPDTIALSDGSCALPGVPPEACPVGFVAEAGGCTPILPSEPCPPGQMAVPGMSECAALASCGEAPWGRIALQANTVFVDASYVGLETGSIDAPYRSVQTAVDAALPDGHVAIAAGSYPETVQIDKPLRVEGRCADLVTLLGGTDPTLASLEIVSQGVEVRHLSISGNAFGVAAAGSEALLERVRVHDTPNMGIGVFDTQGTASMHLRDSLVENTGQAGVYVAGATFTIERSEIRDPHTVQFLSLPISLVAGTSTGAASDLHVTGSFVHGGRGAGVVVAGSMAVLEATAVHDTLPLDGSLEDGAAMLAQTEPGTPRARIQLHGVSIRRCHEAGLVAIDADAFVDATTISEVKPEAGGSQHPGLGIAAQQTTGPYEVSLTRTLIEATSGFGVLIAGANATIDGLLVRGTPVADPAAAGDGILLVTLDSVARAAIARTRVEQWPRAGISSFGADIVLGSSVLECNTVQLDGEPYQTGRFTFEDAGGNVCGCNGETSACKVVSSNLQPPQSF